MPATAATTPPVELVLSKEEVIEEIANAVVVALVVVELPLTIRLPFTVVEPTETKPPEKVRVVEVAARGKGYSKVAYPASLVHCEMFADVKLEVVRPETAREPPELVRPEPRRFVNKLLLMKRLPTPCIPVVVALPTMVVEPTERRPLVKPTVVEVATP